MDKKFFFLHIPKTGGQSINHFFRRTCTEETYLDHIESLDLAAINQGFFSSKKFVSGHLPFPRVKAILTPRKEWFFLTFVREPFSQLLSHLSWVRNVHANPSVYKMHSEEIQELSDVFARTDFHDVNQFKSLVENLPEYALFLFDNCQVRYFADPDPTTSLGAKECARAIKESSFFDYIGVFEDFENSMKELVDLEYGKEFNDLEIPHQNKKNPKIIENESLLPSFREITAHLIRYDEKLYQELTGLRGEDRPESPRCS
jgi:hypothetical protein